MLWSQDIITMAALKRFVSQLWLSACHGSAAAGMTVKFFSLFFMQVCAFRPVAVSLLGVASPLGISAASVLAQAASRW